MNDFPRIFQRNKCFKFNLESVQFAELPDSVMSCFDQFCKNIDDKLGESSDKIHDDLKKIDSEHDSSYGGLETLGVFLPPEYPSQNANMLVCPKRIEPLFDTLVSNSMDGFNSVELVAQVAQVAIELPVVGQQLLSQWFQMRNLWHRVKDHTVSLGKSPKMLIGNKYFLEGRFAKARLVYQSQPHKGSE